jgi:uncharacterized repeat protein (TIGR01451 family)
MGGGAYDAGRSGFLGLDGDLYLTGSSDGTGWPTKNAFQDTFAGGGASWGAGDCILAKFDLREARKTVSTQMSLFGDAVTYTIAVRGLIAPLTTTVYVTDVVPAGLTYATGTLTATSGTVDPSGVPTLTWSGVLSPTAVATITYVTTVEVASPQAITNVAVIDALGHQTITRTVTIIANPLEFFLPLALREVPP